jgi:hypothetical protein
LVAILFEPALQVKRGLLWGANSETGHLPVSLLFFKATVAVLIFFDNLGKILFLTFVILFF